MSTYGQQPGYNQQPGYYGQQSYSPQHPVVLAEHPQAQTVLILGVVGFFVSITSFIGWYLGAKAKKEIEAGAPFLWDGNLKTGYWICKVLSIINIVAVVILVPVLIFWFMSVAAVLNS